MTQTELAIQRKQIEHFTAQNAQIEQKCERFDSELITAKANLVIKEKEISDLTKQKGEVEQKRNCLTSELKTVSNDEYDADKTNRGIGGRI
jgi:chromosome segregation ATPase